MEEIRNKKTPLTKKEVCILIARWILVILTGLSIGSLIALAYLFFTARDVKFQNPIQPIFRFEVKEQAVKAQNKTVQLGFTK